MELFGDFAVLGVLSTEDMLRFSYKLLNDMHFTQRIPKRSILVPNA